MMHEIHQPPEHQDHTVAQSVAPQSAAHEFQDRGHDKPGQDGYTQSQRRMLEDFQSRWQVQNVFFTKRSRGSDLKMFGFSSTSAGYSRRCSSWPGQTVLKVPCVDLRVRTDSQISHIFLFFKGRFKNGYLTIFFDALPGVMISSCPPPVLFICFICLLKEQTKTKVGCNCVEIKNLHSLSSWSWWSSWKREASPFWLCALTNYLVKP